MPKYPYLQLNSLPNAYKLSISKFYLTGNKLGKLATSFLPYDNDVMHRWCTGMQEIGMQKISAVRDHNCLITRHSVEPVVFRGKHKDCK